MNNCIGKRIKEYREKAKLSQEQLGERVNLSAVAISNIERGVNLPSLDNYIKIINALGISSDQALVDVVEKSQIMKAGELSSKLEKIDSSKRAQILAVVETMLNQSV